MRARVTQVRSAHTLVRSSAKYARCPGVPVVLAGPLQAPEGPVLRRRAAEERAGKGAAVGTAGMGPAVAPQHASSRGRPRRGTDGGDAAGASAFAARNHVVARNASRHD